MLITRRKVGEAILIGDSVEVHVLEIGPGRVKLGVAAPAEVRVERKEWKLVIDENRSATETAHSDFVRQLLASAKTPGAAPNASDEPTKGSWHAGIAESGRQADAKAGTESGDKSSLKQKPKPKPKSESAS